MSVYVENGVIRCAHYTKIPHKNVALCEDCFDRFFNTHCNYELTGADYYYNGVCYLRTGWLGNKQFLYALLKYYDEIDGRRYDDVVLLLRNNPLIWNRRTVELNSLIKQLTIDELRYYCDDTENFMRVLRDELLTCDDIKMACIDLPQNIKVMDDIILYMTKYEDYIVKNWGQENRLRFELKYLYDRNLPYNELQSVSYTLNNYSYVDFEYAFTRMKNIHFYGVKQYNPRLFKRDAIIVKSYLPKSIKPDSINIIYKQHTDFVCYHNKFTPVFNEFIKSFATRILLCGEIIIGDILGVIIGCFARFIEVKN
jgi:hypothetical protein